MLTFLLAVSVHTLDTKNEAVRDLKPVELRTPCERDLVRGVRAASPQDKRGDLIVTRLNGRIVMWYGDPSAPDGRPGPFSGTDEEIYRAIGLACNGEINATDRIFFAGTGAGCDSWRPSRADLVMDRYDACQTSGPQR